MISSAAKRRASKKATCPSCGEQMTVSGGDLEARVCCPHCRRVVQPQSGESPASAKPDEAPPLPKLLTGEPDGLSVQHLLEEILEECQQRRRLLDQVAKEVAVMEARAVVLRQWLEQAAGEDAVPDEQRRALLLQCRLFERLAPLEKGVLRLQTSHPLEIHSLGAVLRETFVAAGWQVEFEEAPPREDRCANATLAVAPGPLSHATASVWFALSQAGLHLRSLIDPDHQDDQIWLQVHGWHAPTVPAST